MRNCNLDKQTKKESKTKISEPESKEIEKKLIETLKALEKLKQFSNWMLTVGLATLGFFLTILLQIRFNTTIPNQWLAITGLSVLVFSIGTGFVIRSYSEIDDWLSKFKPGIDAVFDLMKKVTKELGEGEQLIKVEQVMQDYERASEDLRNKLSYPKLFEGIMAQTISLGLGVLVTALYIARYLFIN